MPDDIVLATAQASEWDDLAQIASTAFNEMTDEETSAAERARFEPDRFLVARRAGEIAGTSAVLTRRLAIPGGTVAAGHITDVSVAPTHRRRGVLSTMMGRLFADIRAAGEPIAVLWASEARIYQRFGFGLGVRKAGFTIDSREVTLPPAGPTPGRLREAPLAKIRDEIAAFYDTLYAGRNGWSQRLPRYWDYLLADPASGRNGGSALRAVLHDGEAGLEGYVLFRTAQSWNDGGPTGEVRVREVVATSRRAYTELWRFLLTLDLTRSVTAWINGLDEPLFFMVDEPRRMLAKVSDGLWVRVVDLPAALTARRYATDIDVVIEVTDARIPANSGRWRLTGSPTAASCTPTDDPTELRCDVRALGAAYLGGTTLAALANAGLVEESRPGALATASVGFGWHEAPSVLELF